MLTGLIASRADETPFEQTAIFWSILADSAGEKPYRKRSLDVVHDRGKTADSLNPVDQLT
jgi:hypothetical protein